MSFRVRISTRGLQTSAQLRSLHKRNLKAVRKVRGQGLSEAHERLQRVGYGLVTTDTGRRVGRSDLDMVYNYLHPRTLHRLQIQAHQTRPTKKEEMAGILYRVDKIGEWRKK